MTRITDNENNENNENNGNNEDNGNNGNNENNGFQSPNSPLRKYKRSTLCFTNKDCMTCFGFVDRELHFMLSIIRKIPNAEHFFSYGVLAYNPEKLQTGSHRLLSIQEFLLVGLIKVFNNLGFTMPVSCNLVFNNLFSKYVQGVINNKTPPQLEKVLLETPSFFIQLDKKSEYMRDSFKTKTAKAEDVKLVRVKNPLEASKMLQKNPKTFSIYVDLHHFRDLYTQFVERYFII